MNIQWQTNQSDVLMNPSYSFQDQQRFKKILDIAHTFPGHLWLSTSGSTVAKWVGLSKKAILASAQAVNRHLESHSVDRWIQTLPGFHVGGLGIQARSYLSGAPIFNFREEGQEKWNSELFCHYVHHHRGTLTSLVPAQLYDLVQSGKKSPASLRAVIIGGGILPSELYQQAVQLGWKILPSYGLTECASQVATAELYSWEDRHHYPKLKILPHLKVKQEAESRFSFKGSSLLSTYIYSEQENFKLWDPKVEGWFLSEDRGNVEESYLYPLGRLDQMIKIGGENVDLGRLENLLQNIRLTLNISDEITLVAYPDFRLGHVIHLVKVNLTDEETQRILDAFNQQVLPFEKIRKVHKVPYFPKTALLKIRRQDLLEMMKF